MSEGSEKFADPSKAGKAGLNEEGAEVEGHRALRNEDDPDRALKAGRDEDDGPEVEGHMFRDKMGKAGETMKKG